MAQALQGSTILKKTKQTGHFNNGTPVTLCVASHISIRRRGAAAWLLNAISPEPSQ